MPQKPDRDAAPNRRGSPEAIAKRRAARAFNDLLDPSGSGRLDGRTEKRRRRLLSELEAGRRRGSNRELKPVEILARVDELLGMGETPAALRKVLKPRQLPAEAGALVGVLKQLHQAYGFRAEAYRFLGLDDAVLRAAGVLPRSTRSTRARRKID